jgi:hypothetical protein
MIGWLLRRRRGRDLEVARAKAALAQSTARRRAVERASFTVHARAGKLRQLATENNLAPIVLRAVRARE